jgi:quinol monooxygenase YgiN
MCTNVGHLLGIEHHAQRFVPLRYVLRRSFRHRAAVRSVAARAPAGGQREKGCAEYRSLRAPAAAIVV